MMTVWTGQTRNFIKPEVKADKEALQSVIAQAEKKAERLHIRKPGKCLRKRLQKITGSKCRR